MSSPRLNERLRFLVPQANSPQSQEGPLRLSNPPRYIHALTKYASVSLRYLGSFDFVTLLSEGFLRIDSRTVAQAECAHRRDEDRKTQCTM